VLNYRNQWSAIPGTFTTYQASFDKPLKIVNGGGIGMQFFSDKAGIGSLKTNQFNLLGSYQIKLAKEITSRVGLSTGFAQRRIDYSALTFGDQIARGGAATTVDNTSTSRVVYFDLNMGYLVYSDAWWGGLTLNHLNRPNQSLKDGNSPIPVEIKFH
jgi:type IX secretion system PorP/SprF family membrane protein